MARSMHDRPIGFHRAYAKLTGSVNAGLMLSQAAYWAQRSPGGEFWKTAESWEDETTLTTEQQATARKQILDASAKAPRPFYFEQRTGIPAKLFFVVDLDALDDAISASEESKSPKQEGVKSPKQVSGNHGNSTPGNPETVHRETRNLLHRLSIDYTENKTVVDTARGRVEEDVFSPDASPLSIAEEIDLPPAPITEQDAVPTPHRQEIQRVDAESRRLFEAFRAVKFPREMPGTWAEAEWKDALPVLRQWVREGRTVAHVGAVTRAAIALGWPQVTVHAVARKFTDLLASAKPEKPAAVTPPYVPMPITEVERTPEEIAEIEEGWRMMERLDRENIARATETIERGNGLVLQS